MTRTARQQCALLLLLACPAGTPSAPPAQCTSPTWTTATAGEIWSSPVVSPGGEVFVGSYDTKLRVLSSTGSLLWRYDVGSEIHGGVGLKLTSGQSVEFVYVGAYNKKLHALSGSGELEWTYETGGVVRGTPTVGSDGTIYVGSDDKFMYALNSDGTLKWSLETEGQVRCKAALEGGVLYFGSWDFKLWAVNASSGNVLWTFPASSVIDSSPVVTQPPFFSLCVFMLSRLS